MFDCNVVSWIRSQDRKRTLGRGLPCGLVVENPPSNLGNVGLSPGWGTKIPNAVECDPPHQKRKRTLGKNEGNLNDV